MLTSMIFRIYHHLVVLKNYAFNISLIPVDFFYEKISSIGIEIKVARGNIRKQSNSPIFLGKDHYISHTLNLHSLIKPLLSDKSNHVLDVKCMNSTRSTDLIHCQ